MLSHFQPYMNHDPISLSAITYTSDHMIVLILLIQLDSFEVYIMCHSFKWSN